MNYIKLMRSLKDKSYYSKDSEKLHLWIHLLLTANWSDREEVLGGKPIICKAGQFTTGRKQLSKETGISESKIERLLTYFEKIEQQIEQQKTNTNRLISILNWDRYQLIEQPIKQRVNNKRTTTEQQVNTLKEYKELEEIKEDNILLMWRENFEFYLNGLNVSTHKLLKDKDWFSEREKFHPNLDIKLTMEKAYTDFWSKEAGWKNKKSNKKTIEIDWKATYNNAIAQKINQVYKTKEYGKESNDHVY